jgi:stalled ribosome rescue protein Dom34
VTLLPTNEQVHISYQVAENIKILQNQQNNRKTQIRLQKRNEKKILNQIKKKLSNNNAIISKADKGHSIIIMYKNEYDQNVMNFISRNNSTVTNNNISKNSTLGIPLMNVNKSCIMKIVGNM